MLAQLGRLRPECRVHHAIAVFDTDVQRRVLPFGERHFDDILPRRLQVLHGILDRLEGPAHRGHGLRGRDIGDLQALGYCRDRTRDGMLRTRSHRTGRGCDVGNHSAIPFSTSDASHVRIIR